MSRVRTQQKEMEILGDGRVKFFPEEESGHS